MNITLDDYMNESQPRVTIFGKSYEVESDFRKVLGMQRFASGLKGDIDSIRKFLAFTLAGGETAADEILSHNMSFSLLQKLEIAVLAAMTGKKPEELEGQVGKAQKSAFRPGEHGKKERV